MERREASNTRFSGHVCPICSFSTKVPTTVRIQVPEQWTDGKANVAIICSNCETCILTHEHVHKGANIPKLELEAMHSCDCSRKKQVKFNIFLHRYGATPYCGQLKLKCTACGEESPLEFNDAYEEEKEVAHISRCFSSQLSSPAPPTSLQSNWYANSNSMQNNQYSSSAPQPAYNANPAGTQNGGYGGAGQQGGMYQGYQGGYSYGGPTGGGYQGGAPSNGGYPGVGPPPPVGGFQNGGAPGWGYQSGGPQGGGYSGSGTPGVGYPPATPPGGYYQSGVPPPYPGAAPSSGNYPNVGPAGGGYPGGGYPGGGPPGGGYPGGGTPGGGYPGTGAPGAGFIVAPPGPGGPSGGTLGGGYGGPPISGYPGGGCQIRGPQSGESQGGGYPVNAPGGYPGYPSGSVSGGSAANTIPHSSSESKLGDRFCDQSCPHCSDQSKQQPFFNVDGHLTHQLCTSCGTRTSWSVTWDANDKKTTPKTLITDLTMLVPGDHLAWHRPCGIWHHAILFDKYLSPQYNQVDVVHYNAGIQKLTEGFVSIRREWIDVDVNDKNLYRIEYDPKECFPPTVVMARACERMAETEYNPLKNNCEHFARWCKTGDKRSVQIERIPIRLRKSADKIAGNIMSRPWFVSASDKCHSTLTSLKNSFVKSLW